MNDYNNDDLPEKSARQTAAYRLGYVSVRRLQTKVSEYGGTGKDFMIGKILFNKIKILPVSRSRTENPRTEQAKNAQIR